MSYAKSWVLLALLPLMSSCAYVDYYTQAISSCQEDLTSECKETLEAIIPYDGKSWNSAPAGLKDQVTEAFYILLAYPLVVPKENRLFGVAPSLAGAIPKDVVDLFTSEANPNQSIFNNILNRVDSIVYDPVETDASAQFGPSDLTNGVWIMTIYDKFKNSYSYFPHFIGAGLLVHEMRHGDGFFHDFCHDTYYQERGWNLFPGKDCDNELTGAYGTEIAYLHYLLQGSASCKGTPCTRKISTLAIGIIGAAMIGPLQYQIAHTGFPELKELMKTIEFWNVDAAWVIEHEGLGN